MDTNGRNRPLAGLCATATLALSLAGAEAATAAVRYAAPETSNVSGDCTETACRLDRAVAVAVPGEEVVLASGTYTISYPVRAAGAVTIRPAGAGRTERPRLVAAPGLATPTLDLAGGASARGLDITAGSSFALQLAGGARGIGLGLKAGTGAAGAAMLFSASTTTALVSSVAHATGSQSAVMLDDPATDIGGAALVNVTAVTNGAWGIESELIQQQAVVKNVIARGTSKDVHGRSSGRPVLISRSNVRSQSANWDDGGGNQIDVAVAFADEAGGDLRPAAGTAPIDAGASDPLSDDTLDPDGNARLAGSAPDIGAYEHGSVPPAGPAGPAGPADPGDDDLDDLDEDGLANDTNDEDDPNDDSTATAIPGGTGGSEPAGSGSSPAAAVMPAPGTIVALNAPSPLPPAAPPVLGKQVAVDAASGTPLVRLPGTAAFVALTAAAAVPVGSTIDATRGRVRLTSVRDAAGRTQTGEFWGGRFVVRQGRERVPYTDLVLSGGDFRGCPRATARSGATARAAAKRRKRGSVVRSLWGRDDRGRFRTKGRNSVATVRGTVWLVQDRCDGTRTTVRQGAVDVRPTRGGRSKRVRAGRSLLVPSA